MFIMPSRMLLLRIWQNKSLKQEGKNIPVITTLHGTDITLVGRDKDLCACSNLFYQSRVMRSLLYQIIFVMKRINISKLKKIFDVIKNFVDVSRFNRKPIDAFKRVIAPNGERVLMHASNFRKLKRIPDVIKIFKEVNDKIPSRLMLVGDGPRKTRCRRSLPRTESL